MGGNNNSKMMYGGIALGGILTLFGAAYYLSNDPDNNNDHTSHNSAHKTVNGVSDDEKRYLDTMFAEFKEKSIIEGGSLGVRFFETLQELVYFRIGEKVEKLKSEAKQDVIEKFKKFDFVGFNQKTTEVARAVSELEREEMRDIFGLFSDPDFVAGSYIYGIRNNADEMLKMMVRGASKKLENHHRVVNKFDLKKVLESILKKIKSRIEQGFEHVDQKDFPSEFRMQLEMETEAKFEVDFNQVWSFCSMEKLTDEETTLWQDVQHDYVKLLRIFYHQIPLYSPGIRVV